MLVALRKRAKALYEGVDGLLSHDAARPVMIGLLALFIIGLGALLYMRPPLALEEEPQKVVFFQIGSGSVGGTEFAVGERLAAAISRPPDTPPCDSQSPCGVAGLVAVVKSSLSEAASIRAVNAGHFEAAIVSGSALHMAWRGTGPFRGEKPYKKIRAISRLYHQSVHLLASRGLSAHRITDLKGKRVAIGPKGSVGRQDALAILKAYGLGPGNVELIDAEPARATELVILNRIDALFWVGPDPMPQLVDLIGRGVLDPLAIDGPEVETLTGPDSRFEVAHIPAGTYGFAPAIDTLAISTILICQEEADPNLIYAITQALFYPGNKSLLESGFGIPGVLPAEQIYGASQPTAEMSAALIAHIPIPLHAGAARYYEELSGEKPVASKDPAP